MSTEIDIQSLEQHPSGDELVVRVGDTRVTIDTRGTADTTVEDGEQVVHVRLDDDYQITDVDVLGGDRNQ